MEAIKKFGTKSNFKIINKNKIKINFFKKIL